MKRFKITTLFAIGLFLFLGVGCTSDDYDDSSSTAQNQLESQVQDGTWRITKFIDSDKDETNDFAGYNFTFLSSGVLNADNGVNQYDGTWSITYGDSDDYGQDELDFNINFNLTNDFEDLNDDWDIISRSSTRIQLVDVSGGNGGTDYLTFEKN